jgi:hypothetical protein
MIGDRIAGNYFPAFMYNFSGVGMYCESDTLLKSSTAINVKVGNQRFSSAADRYSGEVRWGREIASDDSSYRVMAWASNFTKLLIGAVSSWGLSRWSVGYPATR